MNAYQSQAGTRHDGGALVLTFCPCIRPLLDLRVSVRGGVHFDLVKRVLRDINRSGQEPEEIIQQISDTVYPMYKARRRVRRLRLDRSTAWNMLRTRVLRMCVSISSSISRRPLRSLKHVLHAFGGRVASDYGRLGQTGMMAPLLAVHQRLQVEGS